MEAGNRKAGSENSDLARQLDEVDSSLSLLHKVRTSIVYSIFVMCKTSNKTFFLLNGFFYHHGFLVTNDIS